MALVTASLLAPTLGGVASADDGGGSEEPGTPVLKSTSNDGQGPTVDGHLDENEHAFTSYMKFYVPTQRANGLVEPVDYYDVDGALVETRDRAKPIVNVFINGPVEGVDGVGFVGHGKRDAYAAVSLDDGETWKKSNLSESAFEASSTVVRPDIALFSDTGGSYPGDVINMFHAVAGEKVLVAWPSRYCSSGQPNYSLDGSEAGQARRAAIADYLGIDLSTASPDDLYLLDMYQVAGQQGSIDYTDDRTPQNQPVGEVPFSCVWTARGQMVAGDDPRTLPEEASYMRWFNTERLTSGRRDAMRIEVAGVAGAGFAMTWQEDPEGLRPGQGEGPGEGWSGAIANNQTDVWYSYIDWQDFDVVQDPADETGTTPMALADYEVAAASVEGITQKPKPFVPMAMPMPITDNAKCSPDDTAPYCWGAASTVDPPADDESIPLVPTDFGLKDSCADTVVVPTGQNDEPTDVCVTEDGLPLLGNTAATRARLNLFGYDSSGAVADASTDSAFAIVQLEEDKGLGRALYLADPETGLPTDTVCTAEIDEQLCVPFDDGKNQWYHSFSMSLTDELVGHEQDGLLANLAFHGNLLNQPEVDWTTGEFFAPKNTEEMFGWADFGYDLYATEIARRGSLLAQDIQKVHPDTSVATGGLLALPTWKQGQMNQGGPADVMSRRIVLPTDWDITDGNPYAFRNMECETKAYGDGSNPYYPEGVCLDSAINLSATVPDTAIDTAADTATATPTLTFGESTFATSDTNPDLQGVVQGEGDTTKVLTWHQCPAAPTNVSGELQVTCEEDSRTDGDSNLADQSWYNPYEVAKGHRGFLDGDFVMMLYAWSPNWRLNTVGQDRYELNIRRSFSGAQDWTTLPGDYTHWDGTTHTGDGTVTCETFRSTETGSGEVDEPRVCNSYAAGAAEPARNVTQHKSMRITTLDPRYAMTGGPYGYGITADTLGWEPPGYLAGDGESEDVRDPSRYFIVYETGDNTTSADGEPEPLDLFYSRGVSFGDDYEVWAETEGGDVSTCYPNDPHEVEDVPEELIGSGFCNEFDQMEQGTPGLEASEASLAANPGGEFLYGTWTELLLEDGEAVGSDAMARRVWWIDGYVSEVYGWLFGQGSGDGGDDGDDGDDDTGGGGGVTPPPFDDDPDFPPGLVVARRAGQDRVATAIEVAKAQFPEKAGAAVLANAGVFADALAGTPLAVAKDAPMLLTYTGELDSRVAEELDRVLEPGATVYLLGGTAALSDSVEAAIVDLGYEVVRFAGATRYETAIEIAETGLGNPATVFLTTGRNFADGLTAGTAAATVDGAVLLTDGDQMVPAVVDYLTANVPDVRYAVGGPATRADTGAQAIAGADRYATSALLAAAFFEAPTFVGITSGEKFPDALSGGVASAMNGGPLMLSASDALSAATAGYLADRAESVTEVEIYGGPAAIAEAVVDAIAAALS
ncbi:choice-of-anchor O protein [Acidimicrobiia bacterium EGI L10123]|uniref:choice-of-anchor O protein n=1 Tax=Salinilacustrithrix flava TaxID=2957203 RepID=UPI003D7C15E4|nr:choice-of-anchor O protein [Acidimicrobiia bacterium EGI L10123]